MDATTVEPLPLASRELFQVQCGADTFRVYRQRLSGNVWEQCYQVNGRGVSVTDYLEAIRVARHDVAPSVDQGGIE